MSKHIAQIVLGVTKALSAVGSRWVQVDTCVRVASELVPRVPVSTRHGQLTLYCPSKASIYWARRGYASEPDTLRWIDNMEPGATLWDIGANVGLYSLYAGLRGGLNVLAFEANPWTYECLLKNVLDNGVRKAVTPLNLALAETLSVGSLYIAGNEAGTVGNAFGDPAASVVGTPSAEVPAVSVSMDSLVEIFGLPVPHHIKIDVDSIEDRIIAGGAKVLGNARVRSVLVEVVRDRKQRAEWITETLCGYGFRLENTISSAVNCLFVR